MVEAYAFQRVRVALPYSEVCMHLRVAGENRYVDVLPDGVQLLDERDERLSFPISHGEAGIDYLGLPNVSDHIECGVLTHFDGTWSCSAHGIAHAD